MFRSLDGQEVAKGTFAEPEDMAALADVATGDRLMGRGSGVCFVGSSFGEHVLSVGMGNLRRILSFDPQAMTITVEAGATLAELYAATIPHDLYVPALPGHPQISVGGCVASNVHGKNPAADGCFVDYVEAMELHHPDHGTLRLSREENPEVFSLTCGGYGLTGVIKEVTLRLRPLPSPFVEVEKRPVRNLTETIELLDHFAESHEFGYSWNDFSRFDERLGRGYVAVARFSKERPAPLRDPQAYPRHDSSRRKLRLRVFQPAIVPLVTTINRLWELRHRREIVELYDFCFPGMSFRNANYYDWYGPAGLLAHMVIVPRDRLASYVDGFERALRKCRVPLLVSAVKRFEGRQRLLRFDGEGVSIHLHMPNDVGGRRLASELEALSREFNAIRAIYVESRLQAADARALYPEFSAFRDQLLEFDPRRRFQSELSRRLEI